MEKQPQFITDMISNLGYWNPMELATVNGHVLRHPSVEVTFGHERAISFDGVVTYNVYEEDDTNFVQFSLCDMELNNLKIIINNNEREATEAEYSAIWSALYNN